MPHRPLCLMRGDDGRQSPYQSIFLDFSCLLECGGKETDLTINPNTIDSGLFSVEVLVFPCLHNDVRERFRASDDSVHTLQSPDGRRDLLQVTDSINRTTIGYDDLTVNCWIVGRTTLN